jgi:hypothetical protein
MSATFYSVLLLSCNSAYSEPTGIPVNVNHVRPYTATSPVAYIEVSQSNICDTNTYKINLGTPGGREIYSTVLAAAMSGKKIKVEASNATGCKGWGTEVQSVYVLAN